MSSVVIPEVTTEPVGTAPAGTSRRRRWMIALAVLVVAVAAGAGVVIDRHFSDVPSSATTGDSQYPTSTATVTMGTLTEQTEVSATLGYADSYDVVNEASGTFTSLPAVGQVVSQGQVLYEVDGAPVVLLYGATPAYRALSAGASAGPDVQELNADLVALGYVSSADLSASSDEFDSWTTAGIDKLQAALGITKNGTLALGQVVFLPSATRVTALGQGTTLGASAQPGGPIMSATSTGRVVTVNLDANQQTEVAVGNTVSITLPNGQSTPGVISSVGDVATAGSSGSTIAVLVTPTDAAATGTWDQAPVNVTITTGSATNAFVVPVDSLLALASGGYALEVVSPKGVHSLEAVTLGIFDDADGMVQVTGADVAAGQKIVVPGT